MSFIHLVLDKGLDSPGSVVSKNAHVWHDCSFWGHLRVCLISKLLLISKFFACCLCRNAYDIIMYMMLHNFCTPGDKSMQQLLCAMQLATRYSHYKCKFQITRVSRSVGAAASVACNDQCCLGLLFFLVLFLLQCNYLYGKALGLGLYWK
jgi:hypothetical protein